MAAAIRELPGRYWRVVVLLTAFAVVNFPDALMLLRLNDIGFSVAEVILAYVGYNVVYALGSYPAGSLADRIPKRTVFGIGMVFFAVGYIGLGLTTDKVAAWLILGAYGLFTACTDGVGKAWISGARSRREAVGARKAYFRARRVSRCCRQVCGPVCCGG